MLRDMLKAAYIIGGIGIIAGIVVVILNYVQGTGAAPEPIACTMDARLCPDGSGVGRGGPSCEFAACPPVGVALGESVSFGATTITPLRVTEDSRCPSEEGVQCIWEGVLSVEVEVTEDSRTKTAVMSPGYEFDTSFGKVMLSSVEPAARTGDISPSEYQFIFTEQ